MLLYIRELGTLWPAVREVSWTCRQSRARSSMYWVPTSGLDLVAVDVVAAYILPTAAVIILMAQALRANSCRRSRSCCLSRHDCSRYWWLWFSSACFTDMFVVARSRLELTIFRLVPIDRAWRKSFVFQQWPFFASAAAG